MVYIYIYARTCKPFREISRGRVRTVMRKRETRNKSNESRLSVASARCVPHENMVIAGSHCEISGI